MTTRTRFLVLALTTPLVVFTLVGGLLGQQRTAPGAYPHLRVFDDVVSLIFGSYVEEPNPGTVLDGAMLGLAEGLDPDSSYLDAAQVALLEGVRTAETGSTGLSLTRQYYLRVVASRDGSPAAQAGLHTGDYIRAIDGKSTRHMSLHEGERLLRGPAGSKVTLTVLRGSQTDTHEVPLSRVAALPADVTQRIAAPGVGLVRITAFSDQTPTQLKRAVGELTSKGATQVLIDLRHTAEGDPALGAETARLFVKAGTLGIREARGQGQQKTEARAGDGSLTLPITVLTTNGTSQAAEVFTAALLDNDRAKSVGERTLGRAGSQKLVKLPDGSGLWLTYARWLTPKGTAIHGTGLVPTVPVAEPDREFGAPATAEDPILDKALESVAAKAPAKAAA
ncbi:putative CtpA-like serine protease [Luteitalea pratensis]|uniref:Putative CtpA-like serine protease n=1 Tax=Luteitalea pratensis TaxID=1855912 RepID=A0A143PMH7_LUTPR|nr:S41 family peptidase [Luteitalea pratensis]AMY09636.1 putative CtpA-like serine protease [Luteitalea pratensis]